MTDSKLTVYGSNGNVRYPREESGSNLTVESDWASGRILILKHNTERILLRCYVSAHTGNHSEQLYLQFETDSAENLLKRFTNAVNAELVEGLGWDIDENSRNQLFTAIKRVNSSNALDLSTDKVLELLRDDQDVRAATSDHSRAIDLVQRIIGTGYDVTIAEEPEALKSCDVGIVAASQYQSQLSLSEENEEYYRSKKENMKKQRLYEDLTTSINSVRTELGETALAKAIHQELYDTQYRLTKVQPDPDPSQSESDPSRSESRNEVDDVTTESSIYTQMSYGLNAVVAFSILIYILEIGLNRVGYSLANTAGMTIDVLVVASVGFLVGYGSLGIASNTSHLSREKAVVLGLISLWLSGALTVAVLQIGAVRTSVPQTVAGLPWWLLLAVVPPVLGLAEVARTQEIVSLWRTESGASIPHPSKFAAAGGIGMLAGFTLGASGLRGLYASTLRSSLVVQIGGGVAALLALGAVGIVFYKDRFGTRFRTLGIAVGTLIGGFVISYGLFTSIVPTSVGGLPSNIILGIVFVVGTGVAIEFLYQSTSVLEEPTQLEILRVDGKGELVSGPKFKVEGLNETGADWVTVELSKNSDVVDDDIVQTGTGGAPYLFIGRLEAEQNGSYTVQAYTGRDGFSGHSGGRDQLDITVTGVPDSTDSDQDVTGTATTSMTDPNESNTESPSSRSPSTLKDSSSAEEVRSDRTNASQASSESLGEASVSQGQQDIKVDESSTAASEIEDSSEEPAEPDNGSKESRNISESEQSPDLDQETDSEESSDSDGYDWEYDL